MNERYKLMRKAAIEAPGPHTSIRQLPLDQAYPSLHDWEAKREFLRWFRELVVEIGREINTMYPRNHKFHIMYLDHALCRKTNVATEYGQKILLEYSVQKAKFWDVGRRMCSKCYERFRYYHEVKSGLFHGRPKDCTIDQLFYSK